MSSSSFQQQKQQQQQQQHHHHHQQQQQQQQRHLYRQVSPPDPIVSTSSTCINTNSSTTDHQAEYNIPDLEYDIYYEGPDNDNNENSNAYTLIFIHSLLCHKGFWRMQIPYFTTMTSTSTSTSTLQTTTSSSNEKGQQQQQQQHTQEQQQQTTRSSTATTTKFRCVTCNLPGVSQVYYKPPSRSSRTTSTSKNNSSSKKGSTANNDKDDVPTIKLLGLAVLKLINKHSWNKVVLIGHSMGYRVAMEAVFNSTTSTTTTNGTTSKEEDFHEQQQQQHSRKQQRYHHQYPYYGSSSVISSSSNTATSTNINNKNVIKGVIAIDGDYSSTGDYRRDEAILQTKIKAAGSFLDMILPFFMGVHFDSRHDDLKNDLLKSLTNFNKPFDIQLYLNMLKFDSQLLPNLRTNFTNTPLLVLQSTKRSKEGRWESIQPTDIVDNVGHTTNNNNTSSNNDNNNNNNISKLSPFQQLMIQHVRFCQTKIIIGGHFPMLENPLGINTSILNFVKQLIYAETHDVDKELQEFLNTCHNIDPLPMDGSDDIIMIDNEEDEEDNSNMNHNISNNTHRGTSSSSNYNYQGTSTTTTATSINFNNNVNNSNNGTMPFMWQ